MYNTFDQPFLSPHCAAYSGFTVRFHRISQPQSIYLYSERKTVEYPIITSSYELEGEIEKQGIVYILVAPQVVWHEKGLLSYDAYVEKQIIPMLNFLTKKGILELVYESKEDKVQIYKVINAN